jgi:16S rRNA (adenine1518-N6/adenine1519-N6)-dimethyltransferase
LTDADVAQRIVDLLADEPGRVIEVGPGRGALTGPLLDRFDRVRGLELDETLVAPLEDRLGGRGLEVVSADALTVPLDEIAGGEGMWQLASNLPYSVGSAILRRLMPRHDLFTRLVVMLQREVAERVVARPGKGNHGLMALEREAWAEARFAFAVHPRAFRPVPKVTSAVVVVDLRPPVASPSAIARALDLAGGALTRPRKMLPNALGSKVTAETIEAAGLDPRSRPGEIPLDGWLRLSEALDSRESDTDGTSQ